MATDPTKPLEEKDDKNIPQVLKDRNKTFSQIIAEQQSAKPQNSEAATSPDAQEDQGKSKDDQSDIQKEEEEKQAKIREEEELAKKAKEEEKKQAAEIAAQTAAEVLKKQEDEKKAEAARIKAEEEEKARQEALKPRFSGVDKDGKPLPTNYDEIAEEGARIGEERALAKMRAELAEKERIAQEKQQQEQQAKQQQEQNAQAFRDQLKRDLDADEAAIYAAGDLPKIKDPNNEKDPGILAKNYLYQVAQQVNAKRIAEKKPLIRSLQVIRYGRDENGKPYYTPPKTEVPGHDAPVLGSESPGIPESDKSRYDVSRDRKMSISQILADEARKASRRLGIRGN